MPQEHDEFEIDRDESKARAHGQVHRLIDILTQEVSLVDRAANKRRFLVVKREDDMPEDAQVDEGIPPHSVQTSTETEQTDGDVSKGSAQLIAEAYKTLSVICSKLEPGKELDDESYQALDKLRSMLADQSKGESSDAEKQDTKCAYCAAKATREFECKDGTKIPACSSHYQTAEKDCKDKHDGLVSTADVKRAQKQAHCAFCDAAPTKMCLCGDGTKILCCDGHEKDALALADKEHGGVKGMLTAKAESTDDTAEQSQEESTESDVEKAGAKLSRPRRKAMRDAVESLIMLLKEVMPETELSRWPLTSKVRKTATESTLEGELSKRDEENRKLRAELAKARRTVQPSNVHTVEEVPTAPVRDINVDWPSDMNDIRD